LKPDPWDFETLQVIDKRIDTSEADGIRDRWEFGRVMLAARAGKKRLPNGYLAELVRRTGKSQTELSNRLRCAEMFPTEAELSNALESYPSWHELVENLYAKREEVQDGAMSKDEAQAITSRIRAWVDTISEDDRAYVEQWLTAFSEETDDEFMDRKRRHEPYPKLSGDSIFHFVQMQADMDRLNRIELSRITALANTDPKRAARHFQQWLDNQDAEDDDAEDGGE
jgi:hypothetical protein